MANENQGLFEQEEIELKTRQRLWSHLSFDSHIGELEVEKGNIPEMNGKSKKNKKEKKRTKSRLKSKQFTDEKSENAINGGHALVGSDSVTSVVDINSRDEFGRTALHNAVVGNKLDKVTRLLQRGVCSHTADETGETPLHSAVRNGNEAIVKELLRQKNCNPNMRNSEGFTPLHIAAEIDHLNICKLLVEKDVELNTRAKDRSTPVAQAAAKANVSVVEYLLTIACLLHLDMNDFLYDVDEDGSTLLHLAVESGSKVDRDKSTAFHSACSLGSLDIVQRLAYYDPSILHADQKDTNEMTPLHRAAKGKHTEVVQFLLDEEVPVNPRDINGKTPLFLASSAGATEVVAILMEKGGDVTIKDIEGNSVLHAANGFTATTEALLKSEGCTNLITDKNNMGVTPVHKAAKDGHSQIAIMFLKKNKACGIVTTDDMLTPLHVCSRYGNIEVAQALLNKRYMKAINAPNNDGRTALHYACATGYDAIVDLLLLEGATIEKDKKGRTPLHIAAQFGSERCVRSIIKAYEGYINEVDQYKNTAVNLAAINGHVKIVNFLLSDKHQEIILNARNEDILDLVLQSKQVEVAMAIAEHDRWKEIITGNPKGVMRQMQILVEKYPAVAHKFLDRCVVEYGDAEEIGYKVCYDLALIQGTNDKRKPKISEASLSVVKTMLDLRRDDCLTHPVSHALLNLKWKKYGWIAFFVSVLTYLAFLLPFTALVILVRSNIHDVCVMPNGTIPPAEFFAKFYEWDFPESNKHPGINVLHWSVVVFTALNLLKEVFRMFTKRMKYLCVMTNYLEVGAYVLALVYALPVGQCEASFKPEVAAFAVFLAWMNLLLYFRRLSFYGTYVIMLITMCQTLIQVLFLFALFMITFATIFFVLFEGLKNYGSFENGFLSIFAMTLGELNYADMFYGDKLIPFRTSTNLMLILFVFAMPIIMMNMLVGLAVGDIDAIKKNASIARYIMQLELLFELENSLPEWIVRRANVDRFTDYPNSTKSLVVQLYDTSIGFTRPPAEELLPLAPEMLEMKQKVDDQDKKIDEIYKMMKLQANILKTISQQSEGKEDHGAENEEDGSKKKKSVWLM